jgi:hypothetical protein
MGDTPGHTMFWGRLDSPGLLLGLLAAYCIHSNFISGSIKKMENLTAWRLLISYGFYSMEQVSGLRLYGTGCEGVD